MKGSRKGAKLAKETTTSSLEPHVSSLGPQVSSRSSGAYLVVSRPIVFSFFEFAVFAVFSWDLASQSSIRRGSACGQTSVRAGSDLDQDYVLWLCRWVLGLRS